MRRANLLQHLWYPGRMVRSPTSVGRPWPWDPGDRGVRRPSGVLTTTMRDARLGVIAPVSRRYERACRDTGRGAPAGSLWRSGVTGAAFDGSLSCCRWGRVRRGLPCPSMVDYRRLTPQGARVVGALRRVKLQLGRFPISKNGYVVLRFRITTLWCSIGCVQMAKLQGRFPISKIAYAVMLDLVNRACIHVSCVSFVSVFPSWCFRHFRQCRTTRSMIVSAEWRYGVSQIRLLSLAYHRLRLNNAATPTAMNPSTNLPVRCENGIAPTPCHTTWHKHTPVCPMTMLGAAKRRKQRCCKPLTVSGLHCHRRRSLLRRWPCPLFALLFSLGQTRVVVVVAVLVAVAPPPMPPPVREHPPAVVPR